MPGRAAQSCEPSGADPELRAAVLTRQAAETMRVPSGETLGGPGWLPPKEYVEPSGGGRAERVRRLAG